MKVIIFYQFRLLSKFRDPLFIIKLQKELFFNKKLQILNFNYIPNNLFKFTYAHNGMAITCARATPNLARRKAAQPSCRVDCPFSCRPLPVNNIHFTPFKKPLSLTNQTSVYLNGL